MARIGLAARRRWLGTSCGRCVDVDARLRRSRNSSGTVRMSPGCASGGDPSRSTPGCRYCASRPTPRRTPEASRMGFRVRSRCASPPSLLTPARTARPVWDQPRAPAARRSRHPDERAGQSATTERHRLTAPRRRPACLLAPVREGRLRARLTTGSNVRWVTPLGELTDSIAKCSSRPSRPSQRDSPRPRRIGTTTTCMWSMQAGGEELARRWPGRRRCGRRGRPRPPWPPQAPAPGWRR